MNAAVDFPGAYVNSELAGVTRHEFGVGRVQRRSRGRRAEVVAVGGRLVVARLPVVVAEQADELALAPGRGGHGDVDARERVRTDAHGRGVGPRHDEALPRRGEETLERTAADLRHLVEHELAVYARLDRAVLLADLHPVAAEAGRDRGVQRRRGRTRDRRGAHLHREVAGRRLHERHLPDRLQVVRRSVERREVRVAPGYALGLRLVGLAAAAATAAPSGLARGRPTTRRRLRIRLLAVVVERRAGGVRGDLLVAAVHADRDRRGRLDRVLGRARTSVGTLASVLR